ncbi:MAG: right-handed parallel beta-helix repeat-containing protein [Planctomycetes bacterium]|nr:right-handed parallel beta-helix repeat-containing protein [Planctomycetota bacterium]
MILLACLVMLGQPFDPAALAGDLGYGDSERCRPCHPRHFSEWIGSVHAVTSREWLLPSGSYYRGHPQEHRGQDYQDRACSGCHMEDLTSVLGGLQPGFPVRLSHAAERAITCTVCHQITDLPPVPEETAGAPEDLDPRPPEARQGYFHPAKPVTALELGGFCGPCHQVSAPNGLAVERTYAQFLESPYPERGITCAICHMSSYGGTWVPGGTFREQVTRHDFIGTDISFNMVPAMGSQRDRVAAFLTASAALFVEPPPAVQAGQAFRLPVEVVNSGAGHNFPAGFPAERRLWLEVEVRLDDGSLIFSSGAEEGDETAPPAAPAGAESPPRAVFTDRFLDAAGGEVSFWWEASRIEKRSLRPFERRLAAYEVPVPAGAVSKNLQATVRLRFQACSPRQLRRRGLEHLAASAPIFDVRAFKSPWIPVVERLEPEGLIRVSGDAPELAEAVRRVPAGGTVLVAPGTYVLKEPIRFGGKDFTLKSEGGAESTILRLAEAPSDPDRASAVIFDGGETTAARLEGFTISGGRGTKADGLSGGGGVYCDGASPTIASNRFSDNEAVEGYGGGVFLRDSRAAVRGNRFERNRAGSGGGLAILRGRPASLQDNRFLGNLARSLGGGLLAVDSEVNLEDCWLQGNQAGRGGGMAVVGEQAAASSSDGGLPARAWIHGARFLGNSAPLGGGLAVERGGLSITATLFSGNAARIGGALHIDGGRPCELINVTLAENTAGSWGAVYFRGEGAPQIRNSILFGNSPSQLQGEIAYSLVDDPKYSGGTNLEGFPLFLQSPGAWKPCEQMDEAGCVPVRWQRSPAGAGEWQPTALARWVPGNYELLLPSPAVNAGSPNDPPDPDGTRRDLGAFHRPLPLRGFSRGDVDGNGKIDLADALALAKYLLELGGLACADAADFDDRHGVTPADLIRLAAWHFGLGGPPASPFPRCGVDPTPEDGVGCFEDQPGCK